MSHWHVREQRGRQGWRRRGRLVSERVLANRELAFHVFSQRVSMRFLDDWTLDHDRSAQDRATFTRGGEGTEVSINACTDRRCRPEETRS